MAIFKSYVKLPQRLFKCGKSIGVLTYSIQTMSEDTDESKIVKVVPKERWVYSVMCRKVIPFWTRPDFVDPFRPVSKSVIGRAPETGYFMDLDGYNMLVIHSYPTFIFFLCDHGITIVFLMLVIHSYPTFSF